MKKLLLPMVISIFFCGVLVSAAFPQNDGNSPFTQTNYPYAFEEDLIEVMFTGESKVRMRNGNLTDLSTRQALSGVDQLLNTLAWHEWQRIADVPETVIDSWETNGERNTGEDIYNLNNVYRLKIPKGHDTWGISASLEALPGIYLARPVPKPMALPVPPNYQSLQGYLKPSSTNPAGVDALWAWTQTGGTGAGITVCDLEYSWNYNHADITKALGSQINPNSISDPFNDNNHGTAVIGVLVADNNGWGTTGICYGAGLKTCATYYNSAWNVPGALTIAIAALQPGDVIIIEQQWDYTGSQGYIPVEWWLNYSPNAQTNNAVYSAIVNAVANGIHVVQAGGNGNINTGSLTWYGNSGAIIVGAGGASSSNDRQRLSFSSYGPRFDLQGWGENVMTTGYGTYYSAEGVNYYYTSTFNGTSSASPVVAGALTCAESYYLANISSTPPTPSAMRNYLVNCGKAQVTPPTGNIGPRPDIKATVQTCFPTLPTIDFGDAPDVPYPTLLASNGARHTVTGLRLGTLIDAEFDGQPNATATGDDINPLTNDDEDGVVFTSTITPGFMASVQVTASAPGVLNAWVDFNQINAWSDLGEQVFTNVALAAGVNNLTFLVPAYALNGYTLARFRFNANGMLSFTGPATEGEVEDYQILIGDDPQPQPYDWGDAPDTPYPTLLINNGARHLIDGVTFLGVMVDPEPDGQPDPQALGDDLDIFYPPANDDEDGVTFMGPFNPGQPTNLIVTASVTGFLNLWVDFNNNGFWGDPGEQVFIDNLLTPGPNMLVFVIPPGTNGQIFCRFRFCTLQGLTFTGAAPNGEVEDHVFFVEGGYELDWGDAPDQPYPTLMGNNGANHFIDWVTYLGATVDPEPDGQPDPMALGDDMDLVFPPPNDDEDGVVFSGPLVPNQLASFTVTASAQGYLNVWFDLNINGSWGDAGEQVVVDALIPPGVTGFSFLVPSNAVPGQTYARFRFCTNQGLSYMGGAPNGEVEDYTVDIVLDQNEFDWGDAPDFPYPTFSFNNGANHWIDGVTYLGAMVDPEPDGQPDPQAMGDDMDIVYPPPNDDEDGVIFSGPLIPNQTSSFTVTASVQGYLNVWVDFNLNGSWVDPGDQVVTDALIPPGVTAFSFMVPGNLAAGQSYARFRFSSMQGLSFTGTAPDGEVEDYTWDILIEDQFDWGDAPDPLYPTLSVNLGASHLIDWVTYLGAQIDAEPDGQPNLAADGDDLTGIDDEDGVIFMWPIAKGNPCKMKVTASVGTGLFNCWIDFNSDGDWADANEHVFIDLNLLTGDNFLTFIAPDDVTAGSTYVRCRFSHQPALSYTGPASDGEVEDYKEPTMVYGDLKWSQPPEPLLPGLHATDGIQIADDWKCNGAVVTDLHWWGNYEMNVSGMEKRGAGINHFLVHIYSNANCLPNNILKSYIIPFVPGLELNTGMVNNEGSPIYRYDFLLPEPFIQVDDTTYWFSVMAMSNDLANPPYWRWQEANRWFWPILCGAADYVAGTWQTITWPTAGSQVKFSDMAFEITSWIVDTLYLQNINVTSPQIACYDANNVIVVAGSGTTFIVDPGASVTMIAGMKIFYLPGTHAKTGSYMHGYITTTGQFCPRAPVLTGTEIVPDEISAEVMIGGLKAYPNPTTGNIFLELTNKTEITQAIVEVYNMMGGKLLRETFPVQSRYEVSLSLQPPGVYMLRVITGKETRIVKVIRQ